MAGLQIENKIQVGTLLSAAVLLFSISAAWFSLQNHVDLIEARASEFENKIKMLESQSVESKEKDHGLEKNVENTKTEFRLRLRALEEGQNAINRRLDYLIEQEVNRRYGADAGKLPQE